MDLNKIKQKLSNLSQDNQRKPKIDHEKVFWRPTSGKNQLRIVPSAFNPDYPFSELFFHYSIGKYPMIALSNFGKQDPVEEFIKELKSTSDSENWSLAAKLQPRQRTFAPVIVRGEESEGVRLWGFSKTVYKALLSLAEDEDIGDFTDPITGFDLVVEQTPGNPYPETSVRIKPKQSALSDDAALVKKWLSDQPNPLEVYTEYDYDFVKKQLLEHLEPGSTKEAAPAERSDTPAEKAPAAKKEHFKLDTSKEKVDDMFDDLFSSDDDDDLPY
jgi:hypothetical protein